MHKATKRALLYIVGGVIFYGTAILFVESKAGFAILFGLGALAIVAAEASLWIHSVRMYLERRRESAESVRGA